MADFVKYLLIDSVDEDSGVGKYLKREQLVEVRDSEGNPWEPVPGPDPWDDLVVVDKADWSNGNVYAVGETISGVSATYTGGSDSTIYRSRTQHRGVYDDSWINGPWSNHTNTPQVITFTIPAGEENGQVRFQTQARDDSVDPVDQVNSFASLKNIAPAEWGNITQTVDDQPYPEEGLAVATNTPVVAAISFDGNVNDVTYEWSKRGTDDVLIGTPTEASTVITFPEQGVFTVTATLKSNKTADWEATIFTFIAG